MSIESEDTNDLQALVLESIQHAISIISQHKGKVFVDVLPPYCDTMHTVSGEDILECDSLLKHEEWYDLIKIAKTRESFNSVMFIRKQYVNAV